MQRSERFLLTALLVLLSLSACSRDTIIQIDRTWLPNSTYSIEADVYNASGYDIRGLQGEPIDAQRSHQRVVSAQELRTGSPDDEGWMPLELRVSAYRFEQPDEVLHTHLDGLVAQARWMPGADSLDWLGLKGELVAWRTPELLEAALVSDSTTVVRRNPDSTLCIDRALSRVDAEEYLLTSLRLLLSDAADSVRSLRLRGFYSQMTPRVQHFGQQVLSWQERSTWTLDRLEGEEAYISVQRQVLWEPDSLQQDRVRVEGSGGGTIVYHTKDRHNLSSDTQTDLKVSVWEQGRVFHSRSESRIQVHSVRREGGLSQ